MRKLKMLAALMMLSGAVLPLSAKEVTDTLDSKRFKAERNLVTTCHYTSPVTGISYEATAAEGQIANVEETIYALAINFNDGLDGMASVSNPRKLHFKGVRLESHKVRGLLLPTTIDIRGYPGEKGNYTGNGYGSHRILTPNDDGIYIEEYMDDEVYLGMALCPGSVGYIGLTEFVVVWDDGEPEEVTPPDDPVVCMQLDEEELSAEAIADSEQSPIEISTSSILRVSCESLSDLELQLETPFEVQHPYFNEDILFGCAGHHILSVRRPISTPEVEEETLSAEPEYENLLTLHLNVVDPETGVITVDDIREGVRLYDLGGRKVTAKPSQGIYLEESGGKVTKRVVR